MQGLIFNPCKVFLDWVNGKSDHLSYVVEIALVKSLCSIAKKYFFQTFGCDRTVKGGGSDALGEEDEQYSGESGGGCEGGDNLLLIMI